MTAESIWIGIDVSKRWLDIHLRPTEKGYRISNDAVGLARLSTQLPPVALRLHLSSLKQLEAMNGKSRLNSQQQATHSP